jgi:hypothetical protein
MARLFAPLSRGHDAGNDQNPENQKNGKLHSPPSKNAVRDSSRTSRVFLYAALRSHARSSGRFSKDIGYKRPCIIQG